MSPTIKDIARKTGVSHSTVSRALSGSALIPPETTARIRQVAAEMGYQPSAAARSLKTRRSRVLGVIVSSMDDPFFAEILQGVEDAAQASGYSLFIASSQRDAQRSQQITRSLLEHRADGVIICSTSFSTEQNQPFQQAGFPIVVINNQAAENFRYSIYHDDVDGARQVTRPSRRKRAGPPRTARRFDVQEALQLACRWPCGNAGAWPRRNPEPRRRESPG